MTTTLVVMGYIPHTRSHVTLAFKHACTKDEVSALIADVRATLKPLLPLACTIGDAISVGPNADIDARAIGVDDPVAYETLESFWHQHQRRAPGETLFPLTLHTTLADATKRDILDAYLDMESGFFMQCVVVRALETKETLDELVVWLE